MVLYSERDLWSPALQVMKNHPSGVDTSQLIVEVCKIMKPSGDDLHIFGNQKKFKSTRMDTHFSQKVRNLKSHKTFLNEGFCTYNRKKWKITDKGIYYLNDHESIFKYVQSQGFKSNQIEKLGSDLSGIIIEEGTLKKVSKKQRKRSKKLRKIAIREFKKKHGSVYCEVCGFSFEEMYGKLGKDFIEVHHNQPICEMDIRGNKKTLEDALKSVNLLCSNCHDMIHRNKKEMLSVEELKKIMEEVKK